MSARGGPRHPPATAEDWNRAQGVGRVELPTATAGKLIRRDFDDFNFLLEVPPVRDNPPPKALTDLRAQFPEGVTREKLLLILESAARDVVKRNWPVDMEMLQQAVEWLAEFDAEEEARA